MERRYPQGIYTRTRTDRTECGNSIGILPSWYTQSTPHNCRLPSECLHYHEGKCILSDDSVCVCGGFCSWRSTIIDVIIIMYLDCSKIERACKIREDPSYTCFIDLQKAPDSVDNPFFIDALLI